MPLFMLSVAHAAPSARELERVLGGYERTATADQLRRLGPDVSEALVSYAADRRTTRVRRMKALVALRLVPSETARAFLLSVLDGAARATEGPEVIDAAGALASLVPYGPGVLTAILPYLQHASADIRQSAAGALGVLRLPETAGPLRARLTVERDPGVRATLARSLSVVDVVVGR